MQLSNNKILITGGGSGIGLALAEQFIKEGNEVIICGRRASVLEEATAANPSIITISADLSTSEGRTGLFNWIMAHHPDLSVLVNNAGIQQWMNISDNDFYKKAEEEVAVNVLAPVHLCSLFQNLPSLKVIMNVTSGLSFAPLTKVPVYSATKAFFHSFTLSLRYLLASRNIEVIELIPPALNTDLGGKGLHDFAPPVKGFIEAVFSQLREGKNSITYGFSENMAAAGPEELQKAFQRMNP